MALRCKNSPPPPYRPSPTPAARAIVEELGNGDRRAAELTRKPRISQPTVPRHLRLLRQAGPGRQPARGGAPPVPASPRRRRPWRHASPPALHRRRPPLKAPATASAMLPPHLLRAAAAPPVRPPATKPVTARSPARMPRRRRPRRPASAPSAPNRPFCATRPQPARRGHSAQTRRSGHPRSGEPLRCVTIDCRGLRTRSP